MKLIFYVFLFGIGINCSAQTCEFSPFNVALYDTSGTGTNVRYEPKEGVMLKLNKTDDFVIQVIAYKNHWLKINHITSVQDGYEIINLNGWIHQSTVAFWARKKIILLSEPKTGTQTGVVDQEMGPIKINDICENWIKVEFKGIVGWVNREWLCGNPVTTCP